MQKADSQECYYKRMGTPKFLQFILFIYCIFRPYKQDKDSLKLNYV